jgi:hypothetical protein
MYNVVTGGSRNRDCKPVVLIHTIIIIRVMIRHCFHVLLPGTSSRNLSPMPIFIIGFMQVPPHPISRECL